MLDLLIKGGMVIDGTGSPGFHAAVGVRYERLSLHRGDVSYLEAARVIDATGQVVCPGFIDLHSHAGLTILGAPHHDPKVRQGVTTELIGIDGISHAPFRSADELRRYIWLDSGLNGYPPEPANWLSVADLLGRYDNSVAVNIAYILGNSPVRIWSVGWNDRPATGGELEDMKAVVREAMQEGAWGLSTSHSRFTFSSPRSRNCRTSTTLRAPTPIPTSLWRCRRRPPGMEASTTPTPGPVHHRLAVVALDEVPASRGRHDAGLGIGEIPLGLVCRHSRGVPSLMFRRRASASKAALASLIFLSRLSRKTGSSSPRRSRPYRRSSSSSRQTRLPEPTGFLLFHCRSHRLVFRCIGLHLDHMAQLHQPAFRHSSNTCRNRPANAPRWSFRKSEMVQVRRVVGRHTVLVETKSNPARGRHSDAVGVDQDLDHHPGMVGRAAPLFALIAGHDGGQIQLVDHVGDEVGQMEGSHS